LVYCASTFNWGGRAASGGVPLPLVIESLLERRAWSGFTPEYAREVQNALSGEWLS
jgi:hypothetical protein